MDNEETLPDDWIMSGYRLTSSCLGHSLTIVGVEKRTDGSRNLLVFDPMFKVAPALTKLIGKAVRHRPSGQLLKAYRRTNTYLRRYSAFEILQ